MNSTEVDSITVAKLYEYSKQRTAEKNPSRTCFACLVSDDSIKSIFDMEVKLIGMIWECTSICMSMDVGSPNGLCSGCHLDLYKAHKFRRGCRQSYRLLRWSQPTVALTRLDNGQKSSLFKNPHPTTQKSCFDHIICISCMKSNGSVQAIFDMNKITVRNLQKCTDVTLHSDASIPAGLCLECRLTLTKVFFFRKRCQRTNAMLKKFQPFVALNRLIKIESSYDAVFNNIQIKSIESNSETMFSNKFDAVNDHIIPIDSAEHIDNSFEAFDVKIEFNNFGNNSIISNRVKKSCEKCNYCKKKFTVPSYLRKHEMFHCIKRLFWKCNICKEVFKTQILLEQHKAIPNVHVRWECDTCKKRFATKYYLSSHKKFHCSNKSNKHKAQKKIPCRICGTFFTLDRLRNHMRTHSKFDAYKCDDCQKVFKRSDSLKKHQSYHCMKKDRWMCCTCRKVFNSSRELQEHIEIPNIHVTLTCDMCLYETVSKRRLIYHIQTHLDKIKTHSNKIKTHSIYKCDICKKGFAYKRNLNVHKRHVCGNKSSFLCYLCRKGFATKSLLEAHKATPNVHKTYQCDICSYTTNNRGNIKYHFDKHRSDKPYKCNFCKRFYKTKLSLQSHQKFYCNDKIMSNCRKCHKLFENVELLKEHMATPGIHPTFKCDMCPYSTGTKSLIASHIKKHMKNQKLTL